MQYGIIRFMPFITCLLRTMERKPTFIIAVTGWIKLPYLFHFISAPNTLKSLLQWSCSKLAFSTHEYINFMEHSTWKFNFHLSFWRVYDRAEDSQSYDTIKSYATKGMKVWDLNLCNFGPWDVSLKCNTIFRPVIAWFRNTNVHPKIRAHSDNTINKSYKNTLTQM